MVGGPDVTNLVRDRAQNARTSRRIFGTPNWRATLAHKLNRSIHMADKCELSDRTEIRVFHCDGEILVTATGDAPDSGWDVKIEQSPLRIFPAQYNLMRCRRPGIHLPVVTPFKVARAFPMAESVPEITVHHREGSDKVVVEACPEDLAGYGQSTDAAAAGVTATGRSNDLSFDEAFADAVSKLPSSPFADGLTRVVVTEISGMFGGIAGFHELAVTIDATIDGV